VFLLPIIFNILSIKVIDVEQVNELYPLRNKPYISIAIPSSFISEAPDLREKTRKIGYIGRAASIFRVEEILIYIDDSNENADIITKILNHQETPPYLKKKIVSRDPILRYAGVLPPLKTPHHVNPKVFNVDIREGIIEYSNDVKSVVDIGLEKKGVIYGLIQPINKRITVKIIGETKNYYIVKPIDKSHVEIYWGYVVKSFDSLKELLRYAISGGYIIIGASKKGAMIYMIENELKQIFMRVDKTLVLFGGPRLDIDEVASNEGFNINEYCHYIVNFVPRQGVESIRTEEAVYIVLSLINYIKEKH
jgi:predicted SPOUT superfamily RNA methylase MTH1